VVEAGEGGRRWGELLQQQQQQQQLEAAGALEEGGQSAQQAAAPAGVLVLETMGSEAPWAVPCPQVQSPRRLPPMKTQRAVAVASGSDAVMRQQGGAEAKGAVEGSPLRRQQQQQQPMAASRCDTLGAVQ
jgi:hypothetical protein